MSDWMQPTLGPVSGGEVQDACTHFQVDLSALVDGELNQEASERVLVHLEVCDGCSDFFEDIRRCVKVNQDLADTDRMMARLSILIGQEPELDMESVELAHRLASVFYQLGKAYVLVSSSEEARQRVFEQAVPMDSMRLRGRGFVDGVMARGSNDLGGVDWGHARGMLNGKLEVIQDPREKARRLLDEAIRVDPSHEEARLYLAHLHALEGQKVHAAEEYRDLFRSGLCEANRGHAAMQLGLIYESEGDVRRALRCYRWVALSGLADKDPRFYPARFNIGLQYAMLEQPERSLTAFRTLMSRHPEHLEAVRDLFANSPKLQAKIEELPGFLDRLIQTCPELFFDRQDAEDNTEEL